MGKASLNIYENVKDGADTAALRRDEILRILAVDKGRIQSWESTPQREKSDGHDPAAQPWCKPAQRTREGHVTTPSAPPLPASALACLNQEAALRRSLQCGWAQGSMTSLSYERKWCRLTVKHSGMQAPNTGTNTHTHKRHTPVTRRGQGFWQNGLCSVRLLRQVLALARGRGYLNCSQYSTMTVDVICQQRFPPTHIIGDHKILHHKGSWACGCSHFFINMQNFRWLSCLVHFNTKFRNVEELYVSQWFRPQYAVIITMPNQICA